MGVNKDAMNDMAKDLEENKEMYEALAVNYEDVDESE